MQNLWPWLFVLACPLMMFFMMRGMHGGGQNMNQDARGQDRGHTAEVPPDAASPQGNRELRASHDQTRQSQR
jgi:hypothetical protein